MNSWKIFDKDLLLGKSRALLVANIIQHTANQHMASSHEGTGPMDTGCSVDTLLPMDTGFSMDTLFPVEGLAPTEVLA